MSDKKVLLCILDGWGHGQIPEVSALAAAKTPYIDALYEKYPNAELVTYGSEVGLPDGQMGNSEVGHLNIGAGRIVYQELARINKAIEENAIEDTPAFKELVEFCLENNKPVHLLGLLSDGGVHSHINHIIALTRSLAAHKITVFLHMFLDGRDTSPRGGKQYMETLLAQLPDNASISSVIGRYYAMDRDNRWERIKQAYDLMVKGKGHLTDDIIHTMNDMYEENITDEFMEPIKLNHQAFGIIHPGDAVLFANFRTDRPRQITKALSQEDFREFDMASMPLFFVTMTQYDESYRGIHVIFEKDQLKNTLGEVVSRHGKSQLRIAETEKYPHVTFFFSGGREEPFENESRILVNSPKVATYDLQPEMSAFEVTGKLKSALKTNHPDLVILNYANADMVGHTGVFSAAVKSAETLDKCLEELIPEAQRLNYNIIIIADHGNSDIMVNPDGSPHTAHTTNPVPIIVMDASGNVQNVKNGKLADVAPTILKLMGIQAPDEMTGDILID